MATIHTAGEIKVVDGTYVSLCGECGEYLGENKAHPPYPPGQKVALEYSIVHEETFRYTVGDRQLSPSTEKSCGGLPGTASIIQRIGKETKAPTS